MKVIEESVGFRNKYPVPDVVEERVPGQFVVDWLFVLDVFCSTMIYIGWVVNVYQL